MSSAVSLTPGPLAVPQWLCRIALLNPNTSIAATAVMVASATQALPGSARITGHTAPHGPALISTPAALQAAATMMEAFAARVATIGADALIVAGFGDPGLHAIRRRVAIPVTGLAEAGIAEAAQGSRRFSIVTVTPDLHDSLLLAARTHSGTGELASIRFTTGPVGDVMASPGALEEALFEACQRAVSQDGAQAVVIGGGPLAQAAGAIAKRLAVPVIDPVGAAVRLTCLRCRLL
jgi:Asp/Glu/hydantoin racemase